MGNKPKEYWQQIDGYNPKLPPTLYHYCSGEAFVNIIKSKTIRLSHISTMSDIMEGGWFIEKWKEAQKNNPDIFTCNIFEHKENSVYRGQIHFTCFSEDKDLKSQWNEYADNGKGFAIGFNTAFFDFPLWNPTCLAEGKHTTWSKIIYDENIQITALKKMMEIINTPRWQHGLTSAFSIAQSFVHKNPSFAEEKEWRLARASIQPPPNMDYRWTKYGLSSFFELSLLPKNLQFPINEVIIGPKNLTSIDHLYNFLEKHSFIQRFINKEKQRYESNLDIIKSKVTLR